MDGIIAAIHVRLVLKGNIVLAFFNYSLRSAIVVLCYEQNPAHNTESQYDPTPSIIL